MTEFSHAPASYICPFCLVVQGIENEHVHTLQDDRLYYTTRRSTTPEERRPYAEKLKRWFDEQS